MSYKSISRISLLCLIYISCNPPSPFVQLPLSDKSETHRIILQDKLDSLFHKYQCSGLVITITNKDSLIFSYANGYAKMGEKKPITLNTYYRIASISKVFIALTIKKMEVDGLLNLEDDVSKYLGFKFRNIKNPMVPIKLKYLLNHTSSLKADESIGLINGDVYRSPLKVIFDFSDSKNRDAISSYWSDTKPGEEFAYSNFAYLILASVIEKVVNFDFNDYLKQSIFLPMNLKATFNQSELADSLIGYTYRNIDGTWVAQSDSIYVSKHKKRQFGENLIVYSPMGGLRISALELAKIQKEILNLSSKGKIFGLPEKSFRELILDSIVTKDKSFEIYSLGFHHTKQLNVGEKWIGHPGEAYGLLSGWYYSPEKSLGITIIIPGSTYQSTQTEFYDIEKSIHSLLMTYIDLIDNHAPNPR